MENLAPVARGVNEIVHQMHGSDVTLQILSHSILYAAITIMQVMQQYCITHSVGLAVSGGGDGAGALPFRPDVAAWSTFSPLGGGMRAIAQVLAMACFLALGAGRAWAQHPQTREGFWIGFGFGYGSLGFSCDGCSGTEGAPSGYLKLGGTLSPNLLIGGETDGWTKSISGTTLTAGNASLALYYYPQATGGFFLRGGVGVAELSGGGSSESGFGLVTGVGYDVRVARNTSITPVANFNWGAPESGVKQHVFQIALGITFH